LETEGVYIENLRQKQVRVTACSYQDPYY